MIRDPDKKNRHLLQAPPVGIVTLSATGKLLSINLDGLNIIGYRESELLGTRVLRHVHQSDHEHLKTVHKNLRQGVSGWLQSYHRIRHAEGHYIIVRAHNAVAHDKKNKSRWIVSVFLDNDGTADNLPNDHSQELLPFGSPIGLTQEMTENLAHEINQPLAAIAMYARVTERLLHNSELKSDEINHALAQLSAQVYRASDVVARIRAWSKVSSAHSDSIDIATLVKSFYPLFSFETQQANISLDIEIEPDVPNVHSDPQQIQNVILVLVRNSIEEQQTLKSGGNNLRIEVRKINSDEVEFSVHNHGQTRDESSSDGFIDMDLASTTNGQSIDLMLSTSIVLSHGGKIGYKRCKLGGGELWFTLPIIK